MSAGGRMAFYGRCFVKAVKAAAGLKGLYFEPGNVIISPEVYFMKHAGGNVMKIYDSVNKTEVEVDGTKGLIDQMKAGRQVDLYLSEKKSDEDGYMSWDVEHWSSVDGKRFIRCYSLEGRVLSESTGHNIYDLENDFKPEEAEKVELS